MRVLKYAHRYDKRVMFASSGAVYGDLPNYKEYAEDKMSWERACAQSGVDCVIARLFTFVGPHLNRHGIYDFIQMAKKGEIAVAGPASVRSYLYGSDLGRWMWRLLLAGDGIYDVGGSVAYSMLEVARIVADVIPCKISIINSIPETHYVPNAIRAHMLGCVETVGLREAIERTAHERI
jgi:nucleoside-diphosphate-sugar epimerase